MPEIKINLEAILKSFLTVEAMKLNNPDYTFNMVLSAMKEACRQTIELIPENVGFIETTTNELNSKDYMPFIIADDHTVWTYNKQSILNTINQIE